MLSVFKQEYIVKHESSKKKQKLQKTSTVQKPADARVTTAGVIIFFACGWQNHHLTELQFLLLSFLAQAGMCKTDLTNAKKRSLVRIC